MRRTLRRCSAALALAAPLLGAAPAAAGTGTITLATPDYELRVATDRLTLTTVRAGRTVLATAEGAFRFRIGGDWYLVREVTRDIFLPSGVWRDVGRGTVIHGPVTLKDYAAPLGITPAFVNLKANGAAKALKALHHAS
ncbi:MULTISPECIES: hypothetical protein [Streptomyces]|uniref:hypothetical protein n=1 Tax=Streptomyces TaxID=1883 RepID=UPI0002F6B0FF|nr:MULTISPECIES: hypothetical protein [Streptomyces]